LPTHNSPGRSKRWFLGIFTGFWPISTLPARIYTSPA
jgi:hypothetical protein